MSQTLPESMVGAIKELVRAYEGYCRQIEEMIVVRDSLRTQIDRLTSTGTRHTGRPKLADIDPDPSAPFIMPDAILPQTHKIVPVPHEAEGAA